MALAIVQQDLIRLRRILLELLERSEADGCVLCDEGGYVMAQEGRGTDDPTLLSALGAGVFAGSRELAKILGEDEFSAVYHQGEKKSLFIRGVTSEVLLVIIFSQSANIGLVKFYSAPAATDIRSVVEELSARGGMRPPAEQSFVLRDGPDIFERA
jgi:predicted regulator of Ras-like GTPase activity (Roadblock/LC7/MglB family)